MIFKNCRLIPELSGGISAEHGTVVCEDGKIVQVYPGELPSDVPAHYYLLPEYDCQGKTLIPGLIDAHTHITCLRGYELSQLKDPMNFFIDAAMSTQHYLDYGFTTIRDCGTPIRVANHVRDAYERGLCVGPRILACGLILSPTEIEEKDSLYELYAWTDSREECVRAARKELAEHADFVKVMASGSALHKQGIPHQPIILEEELRAITDITSMKGSYVAAHAHGDGAIRLCVEAGVRTIEHASYISQETLELLQKTENCYLVPTLCAMYQNPDTTPPAWQYLVQKLQKMLELSAGCIQAAYEAGCHLAFGTDSYWNMEQYERGLEFQFRKEYCHMKDLDILLQATKYSAEALGITELAGEIRSGLAADFVLVDGKPDQDISLMYREPEMVVLAGKIVRK